MEAIVAVYDDWGIGCEGDQPIALSADRKFFRKMTAGSTVIVGRKTLASFPGGQALPKRRNIVLTRQDVQIPGVEIAHSPEEAVAMTEGDEKVFVIGGGTVYKQMLSACDRAVITKVHTVVPCDTDFPNLDQMPEWEMTEVLESGEEDGIRYEMCVYTRR